MTQKSPTKEGQENHHSRDQASSESTGLEILSCTPHLIFLNEPELSHETVIKTEQNC